MDAATPVTASDFGTAVVAVVRKSTFTYLTKPMSELHFSWSTKSSSARFERRTCEGIPSVTY
jgi:hypothetical protein